MSKKITQVRQGEIFLEKVKSVPPGAKKQTGAIVLGKGSSSNHTHEIDSSKAVLYTTEAGERFVRVKKGGAEILIAGESSRHSPITLAEGVWQVVSQREYTPTANRNVAD